MGSQFLRLLREQPVVLLPRGTCPGYCSGWDVPILVCTPATGWKNIYTITNPERRSDLIFVGNGLLWFGEEEETEGTLVIPHYAIPSVGGTTIVTNTAPPTYLWGKHAEWVEQLLKSDQCVLNTQIVYESREIQIRAVQKVLWSSCFWLLCHVQRQSPITVSQVYEEHAEILLALVQELWPEAVKLAQGRNANNIDNSTSILRLSDTLQYLQDYTLSIPYAIPSLELAMAELEHRNGLLVSPQQRLHRALLQNVVGLDLTNAMFGPRPSPAQPNKS